jgi:hypothetical protein
MGQIVILNSLESNSHLNVDMRTCVHGKVANVQSGISSCPRPE